MLRHVIKTAHDFESGFSTSTLGSDFHWGPHAFGHIVYFPSHWKVTRL